VVNILDPDVIVLGGGLSHLSHLYQCLPELMSPHIFSDQPWAIIKPPKWGDASGVRGAARLWDVMWLDAGAGRETQAEFKNSTTSNALQAACI
jgi:predicted NBD/HSP70 family sugar kinase